MLVEQLLNENLEKSLYLHLKGIGLLNNCLHFTQDRLLSSFTDNILEINNMDYIIAPDNGAVKKASKIAEKFKLPLITCLKERDLATGHITKYRILDSIEKPGKALIVDDICDGGATFNILAKSLKEDTPVTEISLYVTHGIFSKGLDKLFENIDNIYSYHPWIEDERLNT